MPVKCEACRGSKEIVGLGNMRKKCGDCLGVGFVEDAEEKIIAPGTVRAKVDDGLDAPIPKRSRKKKVA